MCYLLVEIYFHKLLYWNVCLESLYCVRILSVRLSVAYQLKCIGLADVTNTLNLNCQGQVT